MRRLTAGASLMLCVTALGAAEAQQRYLLRLAPAQGYVSRYTVMMEMFITGGPMAATLDTAQPMMRMSFHFTRTVIGAVGDTITSQEAVDSATVDFPAVPQMAAMSGQVGEMMRGMTTEERATTRGRVISHRVIRMSPALQQAGGVSQIGGSNNDMAILFPEQPVAVGESWTDSTSMQTEAGRMEVVGTYRLDRVSGNVATLSFTGTIRSGEPGAMATMSTSGGFAVDLGRGTLLSLNMTAGGSISTQGMEMPVRTRITMNQQ